MYIDNLTYGEGIEGKVNKRTTEDKTETANMTLYELPVNSTLQNQNGHSVTDLAGSTYAVPNMYEYATFGPDKMVNKSLSIVMTVISSSCENFQ